jgi:hypothetical protein
MIATTIGYSDFWFSIFINSANLYLNRKQEEAIKEEVLSTQEEAIIRLVTSGHLALVFIWEACHQAMPAPHFLNTGYERQKYNK